MKIVGITACPAGVAHTYMAAELLQEKSKERGWDCKIETHGAAGPDNLLKPEEIKQADYVIIATGKNLEPEVVNRFDGKKVLTIPISNVLKEVDAILDDLPKNAKVQGSSEDKDEASDDGGINLGAGTSGVVQHLMSGVSASIPFVIAGGIMMAIAVVMDKCGMPITPYNQDTGEWASISWIFNELGSLGFKFMIPIMGAAIARSIGGKPAFAAAFICSYVANEPTLINAETGAGFLGAVAIGLATGYFVMLLNKIKLPKQVQPVMPFFVVPVVALLVMSLFTMFIVAPIASFLMAALYNFLTSIPTEYMMLIGALLGAMTVADMGGPINKAAWFFEIGMVSSGIYTWYAVGGVCQMLPPMAAAIACWVRPKLFTKQERGASVTTFIVGATVATEPAIPYALAAPLPMISANVLSGAITGALVMFLGIERTAPSITILDPLFGLASPWYWWYVATAVGIALNVLFIVIFKTIWMKNKQKKAENKNE
ncbi:MAG: fructose-specific PTS transporter subunit EIIC [Coriobacteriia bacterium]|nr:fructose-specific PTS transporter subunit EIIC [Coriobacteriia bacterium]